MAKPHYKRARKSDPTRKPRRRPASGSSGPKADSSIAKDGEAPARKSVETELPPRRQYSGARLAEATGLVLESLPTGDYALIDSGGGEKLERYGDLTIRRPE